MFFLPNFNLKLMFLFTSHFSVQSRHLMHSGDMSSSFGESFNAMVQLLRHLLQLMQSLSFLTEIRLNEPKRVWAAPKGHRYLQKNLGITAEAINIPARTEKPFFIPFHAESSFGVFNMALQGENSAKTAPYPNMEASKTANNIGYLA